MEEPASVRQILKNLRAATIGLSESLLIVAAILVISLSTSVVADTPRCDRGLKPIAGDLGYQWRAESNVCEGLYEAKVSASLEIVSYLIGKLSFEPNAHQALDISVAGNSEFTAKEVFVRAVALPAGTYYRMDSALVQSDHVSWLINEVVTPAGLGPEKLGVFGWIGSESDKIFVPLRVTPADDKHTEAGQLSELLIRPTVDIDYVSWRAWTEENELAGEGEIQDGTRAGWPFSVLIATGPPAVLKLEVTAKEANREEWIPIRLRVVRASK